MPLTRRQIKDRKNKGGIYRIRNTANSKSYVGSAKCFSKRWSKHKRMLETNTHHAKHLQAAWNLYGSGCFSFEILEIVEHSFPLVDREQFWIDKLKSAEKEFGYNGRPRAENNTGHKHTDASKAKISAAGKGRRLSQTTIDRIVAANTGKKRSEQFCLDLGKRMTGHRASEATKKKMSESQKRSWTPERRKSWGLQVSNRPPLSEEVRKRMGESRKGSRWTEKQKERKRKEWRSRRKPRVCVQCNSFWWPERYLDTNQLIQSKYCTKCRPIHYGGRYKNVNKSSQKIDGI